MRTTPVVVWPATRGAGRQGYLVLPDGPGKLGTRGGTDGSKGDKNGLGGKPRVPEGRRYAEHIERRMDKEQVHVPIPLEAGTVARVCGDADNGFGLLWNDDELQ